MLRRHDGDADVDIGAAGAQPRGAVLRQSPFGDVEAGDDLDARDQRPAASTPAGGGDLPQQAVDAHAHHEPGAKRLDMDVAGAQLDGLLQQIVDRAHHRRAAGEIAQALDVVLAQLRNAVRIVAISALSPVSR